MTIKNKGKQTTFSLNLAKCSKHFPCPLHFEIHANLQAPREDSSVTDWFDCDRKVAQA